MPEWKRNDREEELRTWKKWHFQLCTWLIANDPEFEGDMEDITWNEKIDNSLLRTRQQVAASDCLEHFAPWSKAGLCF